MKGSQRIKNVWVDGQNVVWVDLAYFYKVGLSIEETQQLIDKLQKALNLITNK
jgi:hypothetical protein